MFHSPHPTLHVYSPQQWHDTVHIVGTRVALQLLVAVVSEALAGKEIGPEHQVNFFTTDGEGFNVKVVQLEDDTKWLQLALPYTHEMAVDQRLDALWPSGL